MSEIEKMKMLQEMGFKENEKTRSARVPWVLMEPIDDYDLIDSDLDGSFKSSSSSEMIEDASSSSSSSSSHSFELSDLMAQLPIKRGISKFYQGKSESFASLTSVQSIDDLAKKEKYSCRSRKSMKTFCQNQKLSPKATIVKNKKSSSSSTLNRSSIFSSLGKMSSLMAN